MVIVVIMIFNLFPSDSIFNQIIRIYKKNFLKLELK